MVRWRCWDRRHAARRCWPAGPAGTCRWAACPLLSHNKRYCGYTALSARERHCNTGSDTADTPRPDCAGRQPPSPNPHRPPSRPRRGASQRPSRAAGLTDDAVRLQHSLAGSATRTHSSYGLAHLSGRAARPLAAARRRRTQPLALTGGGSFT